jgi:hypothetical protein
LSAHNTEPSASRPAPSRPYLIAFIAAIVYLALLIGSDGFISLLLNRDVITEQDAGVLIGPSMALAAGAVVFIAVSRGPARREHPVRLPFGRALTTALSSYAAGPAVGGAVYAMGNTEPY